MVLELHILGPGFSLPSIDPQCLAAISYFTLVVPPREWGLAADSTLALDPECELPILVHGSGRICGFRGIVQFLREYSNGQWDLDAHLQEPERADCTAFSAFLQMTGHPLLDLSLLLTSKNYVGATRPLLSALFPWPLQYTAPLKFRDKARARCQHLGLSRLDTDLEHDPRPADPDVEPTWELPSTLLDRPRTNVNSILDKANSIRLDALTESFLEPLQELLGNKRYLLSERQPSSLDCLAMGYLSLALQPELPQPWLAGKMKLSFERLCGYVDILRNSFYDISADGYNGSGANKDIIAPDTSSSEKEHLRAREALPWADSLLTLKSKTYWVLLNNALDSLPFIKQLRSASRLRKSFLNEAEHDTNLDLTEANKKRIRFTELAATAIGLSVALSYLFSINPGVLLRERRSEPGKQSLVDLGEAGTALAVLARQIDRHAQAQQRLGE